MTQEYANNQPDGFDNYVRNIAIVGAAGQQGSRIVDFLLKTGKHTVTAITREDSQNTFASGVQSKKINYDSQDSIVNALTGQDVLIITMNVRAPPESQHKLISAAIAAKVKYILPNEWGLDTSNSSLANEAFLNPQYAANRTLIESSGGTSSWIAIACGFWYQYSLAVPLAYGFDIPNRSVTYYDDGTQRFNTSTWDQVGQAVTAILSLKLLPEDKSDTSPTLATHFRNKFAYVSSFRISQRDMFESLKRVTGTNDSDWNITEQPSEERHREGREEFKASPGLAPYVKLMYARGLYSNGDGDFESKHGLVNELLGLPVEDLDECTKGAVERAQKAAQE